MKLSKGLGGNSKNSAPAITAICEYFVVKNIVTQIFLAQKCCEQN
jgi:hypothetical protein